VFTKAGNLTLVRYDVKPTGRPKRRWRANIKILLLLLISLMNKGKAIPLQAWTGPEDSKR